MRNLIYTPSIQAVAIEEIDGQKFLLLVPKEGERESLREECFELKRHEEIASYSENGDGFWVPI